MLSPSPAALPSPSSISPAHSKSGSPIHAGTYGIWIRERNNETEPDYLNLPLNELLSPSTKVTASRMRIRIAATCG